MTQNGTFISAVEQAAANGEGSICYLVVNDNGSFRLARVLLFTAKHLIEVLRYWPEDEPVSIRYLDRSMAEYHNTLPTILPSQIVFVADTLQEARKHMKTKCNNDDLFVRIVEGAIHRLARLISIKASVVFTDDQPDEPSVVDYSDLVAIDGSTVKILVANALRTATLQAVTADVIYVDGEVEEPGQINWFSVFCYGSHDEMAGLSPA